MVPQASGGGHDWYSLTFLTGRFKDKVNGELIFRQFYQFYMSTPGIKSRSRLRFGFVWSRYDSNHDGTGYSGTDRCIMSWLVLTALLRRAEWRVTGPLVRSAPGRCLPTGSFDSHPLAIVGFRDPRVAVEVDPLGGGTGRES
ncbi:hypothetical protein NPIL_554141 [Nephila pilipes]|uniref:Uncharacterized protein n=1 Tax=Nephila pilipes TaxID=299642 RepID=A0A8X6PMP4_NEPPI|nr:hypothetical protein NPIL_554141 [Nephila pilipes]